MSSTAPIRRSIQEFWIDFLLEEEFRSDPFFVRSFLGAAGLAVTPDRLQDVTHSLNDEYGEADLVVTFGGEPDCSTHVLLIENKITAGFQPRQAERYRERGVSGCLTGKWSSFRTVLVAPQRFIHNDHGFDASISLEQIAEWVCLGDDPRRAFKIERLQRAIDKRNATGVQIVDPTMTAFREWYCDHLIKCESGFIPPAPRAAYWGDNWMEWTSDRLPKFARFRHRTKTGMLDLSFAGMTADELGPLTGSLPRDISLVTIGTGKPRGAIQSQIEPVGDFSDLAAAKPSLDQALAKAKEIQQIVLGHMNFDK